MFREFSVCEKVTHLTCLPRPRCTGRVYSESLGTDVVSTSLVEPPNLICAAELVSPGVSPATTPTQSSISRTGMVPDLEDPRAGPPSTPSSSSRPGGSQPKRRPGPAPWSTHSSRSIDGDIGPGVPERDSPNPNPSPRALQYSTLAHGYPHSDSSPNIMRGSSRGGTTHSPPRVSREAQEDKEQRRQRAWGRNLYGNSHVSGIRVPAPEGGSGIWFLFTVSNQIQH